MERDRDARGRRFDDGEVVRYGAGESWRPTPRGGERERTPPPRRPRSPIRDRPRSPRPRSPRARSPIIAASDSYVPARYPPRRRSRSAGDRFRRERSRERDTSRRRDRTRSPPPPRRPSPRRSPTRRPSPARDDRYVGNRSPRRDWDRDREWPRDRERDRDNRDWGRDRERPREREFEGRDDRRRSRSPFINRERRDSRPPRGRSPLGVAGGGSYRPRSRSLSRRGDRYQSYRRVSPRRESGISSAITSQSVSGRSSPRPVSIKGRSPFPLRDESPYPAARSGSASIREALRPAALVYDSAPPPTKSPPRGPAALRAPPTGPSANRGFNPSLASPAPSASRHSQVPAEASLRSETSSPTIPPAGPRGYVPPSRGSFSGRGRGGWGQVPQRHMSGPSPGPSTPSGPSSIPTGPRGTPSGAPPSAAQSQTRPFNPPTGPSSQHGNGPRPTLAQSMLATLPPLIPGGKLDPYMTPLATGVTREIEPHYRKLRDEEERMRDELRVKQERLRKSLDSWNRMEREARAWEIRSDLSEKSMKNMAGEGMGGAAF